ncbi:MAG: three-Cys-motif partner protein TcmP, partial [Thermoprotei archaeon]
KTAQPDIFSEKRFGATLGKKISYLDWWLRRIKALKGYEEEAQKIYDITKTCYKAGSWTILKLALLTHYFDVYTRIIKSWYKQAFYVDLCAGCGLNQIEDTGDVVLGSALLADKVPRLNKKFDQLFLIEQDKGYIEALIKIFQNQQNQNVRIIHGDSNNLITRVLNEIEGQEQSHFLTFIDPEAAEISWQTVDALLRTRGDIIINYMCASIKRIWGKARKGDENSINIMNRFFGDDSWKAPNVRDSEDLFNVYFKKIREHKEISIPVIVRGPGSFHYHIIFAVRKTQGTQGWLKAIIEAKEKVEKASHKDAERFLLIYSRKQTTLNYKSEKSTLDAYMF